MNDDHDTLSELLKPRSDISQFTSTGSSPPDASQAEDDYVAFGHGRVGLRPRMMLAFRKCNGKVEVFPYSLLSRVCSDDIDTGFTLTFGPQTIMVTGRNLTQLFRYVCEHRAVDIVEADRTRAMCDDTATVVTSIRIESKNNT